MTWREAMERALYGADGFYRRAGGGPAAHFRTSVHNPVFAEAVARLLLQVDEDLRHPGQLDFVDVGSGRGELVSAIMERIPAEVAERLRLCSVEVAPRPSGLPNAVEWRDAIPDGITGLLIANEWLDNVVFDVAEVAPDGVVRIVEVDPASGAERLGSMPTSEQAAWLARWWPLEGRELGARAEIGLDRDAAWANAVGRVESGTAIAIDYSHTRDSRPEYGSLTGYRDGLQVEPVPDGSCDITAHVALDACADTAPDSGIELTTQRDVLHRLGITGARPPLDLARTDPSAYIRALSSASGASELTDAVGLGGFGWLIHTVTSA